MIVSHKHKYIFLKTAKTAGTSIEIALSKYCGPDDIITPISAEDEVLRKEVGGRGPQNHLLPYSTYNLRDWAILLLRRRRKMLYNHIPAAELKRYLPADVWNSYYKFTIVRNPWDAAISLYNWRGRDKQLPPISEFLRSGQLDSFKARGSGVYMIDGKVVVDRIIRFENMKEELEEVRQHLGLPEPLELPRAKGKYRKDKRHYKDVLTQDDADFLANYFADEIRLMNYTY